MNIRKYLNYIFVVIVTIFIIDWLILGFKINDGNYDIVIECYIGIFCLVTMFICLYVKKFSITCPYCNKIRINEGRYCSYCGKLID